MEEDTWNKIIDIRVNGSLSHFLSYFSVMEPSSPFLYKSIKIDIMNVIKTDIEGMLIIEPHLFRDARGYFFESFSKREFKEKVEPLVGYKVEFCQDNESMSSYGVMRGLHFQRPPFTQSKLVRCVKGRVITSITQRLMGVSLSWMNHLGLIGAFLRNTLIFRKRIRNMRC